MSYNSWDVIAGTAADEKQQQPQLQLQQQQQLLPISPFEQQQQQKQQQYEKQKQQVCAGCNLGPYSSIIKKDYGSDGGDDTIEQLLLPLKSCSRCNQVFYHNIICQKKHYNQHKDFCRHYSQKITMTTTIPASFKNNTIVKQQELDQNNSCQNIVTKTPTTSTSITTFSKEEKQLGYRIVGPNNNSSSTNNDNIIDINKGQRMIGTKLYKINDIICSTIYPCIPPILSKVHRSVRCSICFCPIKSSSSSSSSTSKTNNNNNHYLSKHPKYTVIICDGCYKNTTSSSSSSSSNNDKKNNNKNSKNNKNSTTSSQQQQQQQLKQNNNNNNNIQWLYDEIHIIQQLLYNLGENHPIIILPNSILLYRLFLFCYKSLSNECMIFDLVNSISGTTTKSTSTLSTTNTKNITTSVQLQPKHEQQQQRLLPEDWLIFQDRCFFIVTELIKLHPTIKDQLQYWFENTSVMKHHMLNSNNNNNYLTWYLRELLHRLLVNQFSITSFLSFDFNDYELTDELLDRVVGNSNKEFFEDIGNTLYQNPANRINHSCIYNAKQQFQFYNGLGQYPTLQLIATKTILPNEEINISYISNDTDNEIENDSEKYDNNNVSISSYTKRQKSLQTYYGFTCTCQLCLSEKGIQKRS